MKLNRIQFIFIYFYLFFILFVPDLGNFSFLLNPSVIILLSGSIFLVILNKKIIRFITLNKILVFVGGYLGAAFINIYSGIIFNNSLQILYYLNMGMQFINIISIIIILAESGLEREGLISVIFKVYLIQAFIIISMLLIPDLKNIANNLYFNNLHFEDITPYKEVVKFRIYGIAGDFTFSTSIATALVAVIALIMGIYLNKKIYYFYFVLFLFTSLLNGRTGIIIAFICIFVLFCYYFIENFKCFNKSLLYFVFFGCCTVFCFAYFILVSNSFWSNWIKSGIYDVVNILFKNSKTGVLDDLLSDMLFFPENWHVFYGYGQDVFLSKESFFNGKHSDIGYINDLFRGGIIYIVLLYLPIYLLIKKVEKKHIYSKSFFLMIKIALFMFIIIGNFKGSCMNSNPLYNSILYIALVFSMVFVKKAPDST